MKPLTIKDTEYICDLQAPCFQILPPDELELIRASKTQVMFRKGDNLTKQGTFASYILFIANGLATQYVEGESRKSFNLKIISPGEFIGMFSLFSKNTFNYSSVALTDCHVFLVEKDTITKIMNENAAFGLGLMNRYAEQNVNLFDSLRNVLFKQMNGRFADTLLYIDSFKEEYPAIFQLLSRKDIADFAGISTESAVKLLKALEREGCIKLDTKDIVITNYNKLKDISRIG
jgi:CRP-like cAMP-binding protein